MISATAETSTGNLPRIGMVATIRNRRGIITAVEPYSANGPVYHLVTIEYLDNEGESEEVLLWEREISPKLLQPSALPDVSSTSPMSNAQFDALVRATRWSALTPFVDAEGQVLASPAVTSPIHGAIQVEDFQLVPLMRALTMPRISLLIADDVGLGKTIEAGLILSELINRRRIRRVLIISPASLSLQWQDEMREKFCLNFDVVDREETHSLRKRIGMDANPWRVYSRCVTSYYYLKQPDVREQFRAAAEAGRGMATLPWDLLIVDEAHNLMPAPIGEDSDLAELLTDIAPYFEHKIFLSATPHNGHTRSFSGLLERLDPVRFSQTSEFKPAERQRIEEVVVRRLKSEINTHTSPKRFCEREPVSIPLTLTARERRLSAAFQDFRKALMSAVATSPHRERVAGRFAVEILGKRLLSSPATFAESWRRCRAGLREQEQAQAADVNSVRRDVMDDTGDDRERESRERNATQVVGAWLKPYAELLRGQIAAVDEALTDLGLIDTDVPVEDSRWEAFCDFVDSYLRTPAGWRDDERLIVFTEYKTTLDYVAERLKQRYGDDGALLTLFGGVSPVDREAIKSAFNKASNAVRILIATDTGSEGQNLQETARYLMHYDIPWNPSRIEQRNGRVDRHGQSRDVFISHFVSNDDADLKFLSYVLRKVDKIREDLGSVGEVFDSAVERKLLRGGDVDTVISDLDADIERVRKRAAIPYVFQMGSEHQERLDALRRELDLDPSTLRSTLEAALGAKAAGPRIDGPDAQGRLHLNHPIPTEWVDVVDEALRRPIKGASTGAMPAVVFDPEYYIHDVNGRPVFRGDRDTALLHLGHPMFRRALAAFARYRFPGGEGAGVSRWTVRRGGVPDGADALLLITVEELAVNGLREAFHHWVRTIELPVVRGVVGEPLPARAAADLRLPTETITTDDKADGIAIWDDVYHDVRDFLARRTVDLRAGIEAGLRDESTRARQREVERFASRQGELSERIQSNTIQRLEREINEIREQRQQMTLAFDENNPDVLLATEKAKQEEIARRLKHMNRMRDLLESERKRVLDHLLPERYALHGDAHVFPVAVEIRLPSKGGR